MRRTYTFVVEDGTVADRSLQQLFDIALDTVQGGDGHEGYVRLEVGLADQHLPIGYADEGAPVTLPNGFPRKVTLRPRTLGEILPPERNECPGCGQTPDELGIDGFEPSGRCPSCYARDEARAIEESAVADVGTDPGCPTCLGTGVVAIQGPGIAHAACPTCTGVR